MRQTLVSWASIFALVTAIAGGCDERTPESHRRAPRVVDSSSELFVIEDTEEAKIARSTEELIGNWTPPAKVELARPSPSALARKRGRVVDDPPPAELVDPRAEIAAPSPRTAREEKLPSVAPRRDDPGWYTPPPPPSPRSTAINVSLVVGAIAVGMGTTAAASSDGAPGDRAFLFTTLGIGAASFGTALVLHLTEPEAKPKAGANVSFGPLGMRGTF
jgi:hypothetical protein